MIEYKKKKILLQSGRTRNFYYKVISNGKKKQISKIEYLNKKGGGPTNAPVRNPNTSPYILITCGPTGSGKSRLIDKSLTYLKLEKPSEENIFIIDNLVEKNENYKIKSKEILEKYFLKTNTRSEIEQKIKSLLTTPINNKTTNIFKEFTDAYFTVRGPAITMPFDDKIKLAIENDNNFIIETTGRSFPSIIGWTDDHDYKVFISYSLVEFCTLIDRNVNRMIDQIELFYKNNSLAQAPRLPDIRLQKFGEVVNIILNKLITIIDKCNTRPQGNTGTAGNNGTNIDGCKTNHNFHTNNKPWTDKNFRLIIFDNTTNTNNNVPIFDSANKTRNLDAIKQEIKNKYLIKNKCN